MTTTRLGVPEGEACPTCGASAEENCRRMPAENWFATEDEAAAFIGTLEDHDAGIYYLDGPER